MANTKYLICSKCGIGDLPTKGNPGTSTLMRCPDCDEHSKTECKEKCKPGYATMCRACCPTGHQTHGAASADVTDSDIPREEEATA